MSHSIVWKTNAHPIIHTAGSDTVFYMFVRAKFSWTIQQYNVYDSTSIVTQVFGNVFGIYVLIKVSEANECVHFQCEMERNSVCTLRRSISASATAAWPSWHT